MASGLPEGVTVEMQIAMEERIARRAVDLLERTAGKIAIHERKTLVSDLLLVIGDALGEAGYRKAAAAVERARELAVRRAGSCRA